MVLLNCKRLKLINANVNSVPKLKMDASASKLPDATTTIRAIEIPLIITVIIGMPLSEILEKTYGITSCRAMQNKALEPPIIDDNITEVVAKSADMATNSSIQMLLVATPRAVSSGAVD